MAAAQVVAAVSAEIGSAHEEARRIYIVGWTEWKERCESLLREQQATANETLALEQLRLEILGKADNAAAADKRLEKLRRQSQSLTDRAKRELERERDALRLEAKRLEERDQALRKDENAVLVWKRALAKRRVVLGRRLASLRDEELQRKAEVARLQEQHEADVKHLQALREEIERVARALLETDEPPAQAA